MPPRVTGYELTLVARGIDQPWSIAWLPDGRALVTAKKGALYVLEGDRFREIELEGLPPVMSEGQGGLMDVAPHPKDTGPTPRIYLTMSTGTANANRTDRKSTRLNSSHVRISYAVFCLKKKNNRYRHH